jgi:hypothetical protein
MTGYSTDKKPASPPPIKKVSGGFRPGQNPAATFNKGASSLAEIQKSTDAVRQRSAELSRTPTFPRGPQGHDAK